MISEGSCDTVEYWCWKLQLCCHRNKWHFIL